MAKRKARPKVLDLKPLDEWELLEANEDNPKFKREIQAYRLRLGSLLDNKENGRAEALGLKKLEVMSWTDIALAVGYDKSEGRKLAVYGRRLVAKAVRWFNLLHPDEYYKLLRRFRQKVQGGMGATARALANHLNNLKEEELKLLRLELEALGYRLTPIRNKRKSSTEVDGISSTTD
jgi:hypothetical protein